MATAEVSAGVLTLVPGKILEAAANAAAGDAGIAQTMAQAGDVVRGAELFVSSKPGHCLMHCTSKYAGWHLVHFRVSSLHCLSLVFGRPPAHETFSQPQQRCRGHRRVACGPAGVALVLPHPVVAVRGPRFRGSAGEHRPRHDTAPCARPRVLRYDFRSRGSVWLTADGGRVERHVPRSIWWGLEWVRCALNGVWDSRRRRSLCWGAVT